MTGKFPEHDVDHVNGNRTDNRWENLREVTRRENMMNVGVRSNSTTQVTGVSRRKDTGKYQVYVDVMGVRTRLGCYDTLEEAALVREQASKSNGFHENHGRRKRWQR
jgi:ribosome-binding factor A